MGKVLQEYVIGKLAFWVCLLTSLTLLAIGFILPPLGIIDPSVLKAVGEIFGFATLGVIADGIKEGYDAKIKHGDTEVEITNDK